MTSSISTASPSFYELVGLHIQSIPKKYKICEISIKILLTAIVKQEYFEGTIRTPISFKFSYKNFGSGDLKEVLELIKNLSNKTLDTVKASVSFDVKLETSIRYFLPDNKTTEECRSMEHTSSNDTQMFLNKKSNAKT